MANPYSKCGMCGGNMWPGSQMDHPHTDGTQMPLKKKYRLRPITRSAPVASRTNPSNGKTGKRSIAPRRHAYGPF